MCRLSTIRSAIRRRIIDIGSISTRSPSAKGCGPVSACPATGACWGARDVAGTAGAGAFVTGVAGAAGAGAGVAVAAAGSTFAPAPRFSTKLRMSCLVTRPPMPVPSISEISMPCSSAIFRTSGDERVRRNSSFEVDSSPALGAGGVAAVDCGAGSAERGGGGAGAWGGGGGSGCACLGLSFGGAAGACGAAGRGSGCDCLGSSFGAVGASFAAAAGFAPSPPPPPPPPPPPLITATTVLTATVSPSWTIISESTPEVGAGISASTLSVEISKSGSSRLTGSPTFLSHLTIVPSAMDSPICGIFTSSLIVLRSDWSVVRGPWSVVKRHRLS